MRLIPLRLRWCLESKTPSRLSWRNLFPFTLQRGNLKTKSPVILDLCLRKTRAGKSHDYRDVIVFKKIRLQNVFHSTLKRKAGVFKFLRFNERFRKASFSWRINVDGRPNRTNKASWRRERVATVRKYHRSRLHPPVFRAILNAIYSMIHHYAVNIIAYFIKHLSTGYWFS